MEDAESIKLQKEKKKIGNDLGAPENMEVHDVNVTKKGAVSLPFANLFRPCLAGAPGPIRELRQACEVPRLLLWGSLSYTRPLLVQPNNCHCHYNPLPSYPQEVPGLTPAPDEHCWLTEFSEQA